MSANLLRTVEHIVIDRQPDRKIRAAVDPFRADLLQEHPQAALAADSVNGASADEVNNVCWAGAMSGLAREVISLCDIAVGLAPADDSIIDSRGLARALTGNPEGAIKDFRGFMLLADSAGRRVREEWIEELRGDGLTLQEARATLQYP